MDNNKDEQKKKERPPLPVKDVTSRRREIFSLFNSKPPKKPSK